MMKERSHAFDLLCGICIVRMVMLHITQFCGFTKLEWWTEIMHWSYFFMSFFFFKAGYFNKTIGGDTKAYLLDKTRRLMVPYFSWGIIGCIVYFFFVIFIFPPKHTCVQAVCWEHLWNTSCVYGNDPLWFLMSFYLMYVFVHLIEKIPHIRIKDKSFSWSWVVVLFPYVSFWLHQQGDPLPLNISNVFFGVFLFWLGKLWHKFVDRMGRSRTIMISLVLIAVFIVLNSQFDIAHNMLDNRWDGDFLPLFSAIVCVICGLSGLLLSLRMPRIPLIGFIGEHSMVYFVCHMVILTFYNFVHSANTRSLRGHWEDYFILIFIIFTICSLLVPHVEKIPFLSGRYQKRKYKLWII